MSDYPATKARIFQWMIIILISVSLGGAYWFFNVSAATKINSSQNATNTNGLVGQWSFDGADVTSTTTYATWNPVDKHASLILSGGNLTATASGAASNKLVRSTISKSSGKWYWEITVNLYTTTGLMSGIANASETLTNYLGQTANSLGYHTNNSGYWNGAVQATGATYGTGAVIGVALNADTGNVDFYKNGVFQIALTGVTGPFFAAIDIYTANDQLTANFGATAFTYTPPAGYNAGLYTSTLSGATDTSGSGNNGTLVNGPTTTIGKIGQALSFDGTNDYGYATTGAGPTSETQTGWFKTSIPAAGALVSIIRHDGNMSGLQISDSAGIARCAVWPGGSLTLVSFAWNYGDNNWHFIACTFDSAIGTKVYVDNVLVATSSVTGNLSAGVSTLRFGSDDSGTGERYAGSLDDVRIYNRALSTGEMTSLYNMGVGAKVNASQNTSNTNGLVGQWSFNGADISGSTQVFATLDPAAKAASVTLSNGNLTAAIASTGLVFSTIGKSNGNRYWEVKINTLGSSAIGVAMGSVATSASPGSVANSVGIRANGDIWMNGSLFYNVGSVLNVNDIISIVIQGDGSSIRFRINNVDQGGFSITPGTYFAAVGSSGGATNLTANFGATPLTYTSGFSGYEVGLYTGSPTSSATDTSGSSNTGTLIGVSPIIGKVGQALNFDGSTSSGSVPDAASLKPTSAISYGGWVYVPSTPGGLQTIIEKGTATTAGYALYVTTDPKICFVIKTSGGTETDAGPALTTGAWHHIMVTYDSSTPLLYIDGTSQSLASGTGCTASTNTGSITQDTNTLTFGSRQGTSQFFTGKEDEIRIYNRTISAGEVLSLYNMGVGTKLTP